VRSHLSSGSCAPLSTRQTEGVFGSVVAVSFQRVFCSEMHQNNVFIFLKNNFNISSSKRSENTKINKLMAVHSDRKWF
jgi:hypothetical protein